MSRCGFRYLCYGLAVCLLGQIAANGQSLLRDDFEGAEPSWRDGGGQARYRIETLERQQGVSHSGNGSEHVELSAGGNGRTAFLSYPLGRAPVIPELRASLWLRSDRAGAQLLARVVLPRSLDAKTNQPITLLLPGGTYSSIGQWQELRLDNAPALLNQQAWNLRVQMRTTVDLREAYVDALLLNVYTGEGRSQTWIDDLEIRGVAHDSSSGIAATEVSRSSMPLERRTTVELSGGTLLIDGRPFFPRLIEHRGEPLRMLRQLGFNGVVVDRAPSAELLAEARQLGLWIVAPPPAFDPNNDRSAEPWGSEYDAVLAWHLGSGLSTPQLEPLRRFAEVLRRLDRRQTRPLIAGVATDLNPYSRVVDLLVMDRSPIGTSFEQRDYGPWLEQRVRLARPGTSFWSTVQTELAPELIEQMSLVASRPVSAPVVSADQLRALVYASLASGSRGLIFRSNQRLDGTDSTARIRALQLELINLELELLESWTSGGSQATTITSSTFTPQPPPPPPGSRLGDPKKLLNPTPPVNPDVVGLVLQTDRARVLLPSWQGRGGQYVGGQTAANNLAFVLPGAPESTEAYELTAGGLRPPYKRQRATGGIRVVLDEAGMGSMVVLTQDPLVIRSLTVKLAETGRRCCELQRQLVAETLARDTDVDAQLAGSGQSEISASQHLATTRMALQQSDQRLAENDLATAFQSARRATRPLQLLERAHWLQGVQLLASPLSSPLATTFATLPDHQRFMVMVTTARWQPHPEIEGGFEDLGRMVQAGWQHQQHPLSGIDATVELSRTLRRSGAQSLRLAATASPDRAGTMLESPPVWMTSPVVMVEAGTWYRISGWIYIPASISGTFDGLMISDSLTGEPLAERMDKTTRWQPLVMLRAAPRSGPLSVTFALTGIGEAWIDDLAIETVAPPQTGSVPVGARPYMPRR